MAMRLLFELGRDTMLQTVGYIQPIKYKINIAKQSASCKVKNDYIINRRKARLFDLCNLQFVFCNIL